MNPQRAIFETSIVQGVPLFLCTPDNTLKAPLVVYIHGFTGTKIGGAELAYRLAEIGIATLSLDAAMHGDRPDEALANSFKGPQPTDIYPYESGLDRLWLMFQIIQQTADDISKLLDHYAADPRIDVQNTGVCGASMGGMIAYLAAAREPRIRAAAPQISLPGFLELWQDALIEGSCRPDWAQALHAAEPESKRREKLLRRIDPVDALIQNYAPKPLFIQCGDEDFLLPKSYSVRFYRQILPCYSRAPDRLSLRIYEHDGHRVSHPMLKDAADWFERYL